MYRNQGHRERDSYGGSRDSGRRHNRSFKSGNGGTKETEPKAVKEERTETCTRQAVKPTKQHQVTPQSNKGTRQSYPQSHRYEQSPHHPHRTDTNNKCHHNHTSAHKQLLNQHHDHVNHHNHNHSHHHHHHNPQQHHHHQTNQSSQYDQKPAQQQAQASPQSKSASYYAGPKFLTPPLPSILPMPPKSWLN